MKNLSDEINKKNHQTFGKAIQDLNLVNASYLLKNNLVDVNSLIDIENYNKRFLPITYVIYDAYKNMQKANRILELLLEQGADIYKLDERGENAISQIQNFNYKLDVLNKPKNNHIKDLAGKIPFAEYKLFGHLPKDVRKLIISYLNEETTDAATIRKNYDLYIQYAKENDSKKLYMLANKVDENIVPQKLIYVLKKEQRKTNPDLKDKIVIDPKNLNGVFENNMNETIIHFTEDYDDLPSFNIENQSLLNPNVKKTSGCLII